MLFYNKKSKNVKTMKRSFSKKRKKTRVKLNKIDPYQLDRDYNIKISSNITDECKDHTNHTNIADVVSPKNKGTIKFFDHVNRDAHTWIFTMKNHETLEKFTRSGDECCFHDRNPIPHNVKVLSCPVKYIPHMLIEENNNEFGANCTHSYELTPKQFDHHVMKKTTIINPGDTTGIKTRYVVRGDYYLTDGFFCSFNCMLSFINKNKHTPLYKESLSLMNTLYLRITGSLEKILPAPSWRLLKSYGGFMEIEDFYNSLGSIVFKDMKNVFNRCRPIGIIYSEDRVF
jgi:hypothetical protein